MFDIPSFRIGKFFGIPVEVNLSWIVIFALVVFSLGSAYFPTAVASLGANAPTVSALAYYLVAAVTTLLFFGSILAHELSHSLVARASGGHVDRITLFIFGGVAQIDEEPKTPSKEFLMAAAGPGMSLVIALVCFLGYLLAAQQVFAWWLWAPLEYLAVINLFVAIFNLLPGFPLDGGRVLRSILWGITHDLLKATLWAVRVGQFIGWSMVALAVYTMLQGSTGFLWFGLIGWFIASLAGQAYRQQLVRSRTAGVQISQIMSPSPEYVDGGETLETLVQDHFLGRRHSRYPVFYEGAIVGLVTLPDVKTVDRSDWPFMRTIDVTNRDLPSLITHADTPVDTVLSKLAADRPGALIVVEDGRLAGIVTRSDIISLLQRDESV
ncbi:MAG TPA: site-2 protease family protein [Coriobacteriia bacterium]|nr:site-2 protease family protein [Coriobacteriia bacterium]